VCLFGNRGKIRCKFQRDTWHGRVAALCAGIATPLAAQSYSSKVIKIIMPFPIGGTNDIIVHAVGDRLAPAAGRKGSEIP
jgi:tripartite-type tricarboxylate transporter receptor subunit TctC